MKGVSLFSGCGGSDLGATRAGIDVIFANDNDKNAVATFKKYKDLCSADGAEIIESDVSEINTFPSCDILIGCYPCQSFTMGGPRSPEKDSRTNLYLEFERCLSISDPKYFVTENVAGMAWLNKGEYLCEQIKSFMKSGRGYNISSDIINAKDYGIPQDRRRVFIIGVRKDIEKYYWFPRPTHGPCDSHLAPWISHGDAISMTPVNAEGEYYDYPPEPFSWWYLSRNRKRNWEEPSYAIQANWRHVPLHPASPTMRMVESNLNDGFKQRWEFTDDYDHIEEHIERPVLERPRRLSWRECAAIQTFPSEFEPVGPVVSKFKQIGNATPPLLMEIILRGIVAKVALRNKQYLSRLKSLSIIHKLLGH